MSPSTYKLKVGLDSQVATRRFRLDTEWTVITGAPCASKTTVLEELSRQGFEWNLEVARIYVERQLVTGHTLQEIRANVGRFQRALIDTKIELELDTDPNKTIFFDRAIPDSITYYRVAGLDSQDVVTDCFHPKFGS